MQVAKETHQQETMKEGEKWHDEGKAHKHGAQIDIHIDQFPKAEKYHSGNRELKTVEDFDSIVHNSQGDSEDQARLQLWQIPATHSISHTIPCRLNQA